MILIFNSESKIQKEKEELEKEENKQLVFHPDIYNPCICGIGLGSDISDENELKVYLIILET